MCGYCTNTALACQVKSARRRMSECGRCSVADLSLRVGRASPLVQGRARMYDPRSEPTLDWIEGRGRALPGAAPTATIFRPHPCERGVTSISGGPFSCHVERSEAQSRHLAPQTTPLSISARPLGYARGDRSSRSLPENVVAPSEREVVMESCYFGSYPL